MARYMLSMLRTGRHSTRKAGMIGSRAESTEKEEKEVMYMTYDSPFRSIKDWRESFLSIFLLILFLIQSSL